MYILFATKKNYGNIFCDKMTFLDFFLIFQASYREGGSLKKSWASHREAGPLTGKPGLSQGGRAFHKEAGPFTEAVPSLGGRASHREAGPLAGRPGGQGTSSLDITILLYNHPGL